MTRLSAREILDRLVAFPTISRETNLPLVDWVQDYLAEQGIESHRWVDPEQPHKAAVFAHVGPWQDGAVVLYREVGETRQGGTWQNTENGFRWWCTFASSRPARWRS